MLMTKDSSYYENLTKEKVRFICYGQTNEEPKFGPQHNAVIFFYVGGDIQMINLVEHLTISSSTASGMLRFWKWKQKYFLGQLHIYLIHDFEMENIERKHPRMICSIEFQQRCLIS